MFCPLLSFPKLFHLINIRQGKQSTLKLNQNTQKIRTQHINSRI